MRHALTVFTALAATACQPEELQAVDRDGTPWEPAIDVGEAVPTIFYGSAPYAPRHDATVALNQRYGNQVLVDPFCSGVLVADDIVMTAAHCVTTSSWSGGTSTTSSSSLVVYVGDDPSRDLIAGAYTVRRVLRHPSYDDRQLVNDLALLYLDQPVAGVDPVPVLPPRLGLQYADVGSSFDVTGFGVTHTGSSGRKLTVNVPIGGPVGGTGATQVEYAQRAGGPCSGDSGGPAFFQRGGAWYTAGVTSYGDARCTSYGVSTYATMYTRWLRNNGL